MKRMWRAPFSAAAAIACASIGSHFYERLLKAKDEWAVTAYALAVTIMGILTVAETLQVWQELGVARE